MIAVHNPARLDALRRSGLLDSPPEESFDRLTRLASTALHAPVALVSLVDQDRQFFKSCVGLSEAVATARSTPLEYSFCQHAVASGEPLIIPDARAHPVLCDNPAIRDHGFIAYAGVPLVSADGHALGTLCVLDFAPRAWTEREVRTLQDLASVAGREIAFRHAFESCERAEGERERLRQNLDVEQARLSTVLEQAPAFIAILRGRDHVFEAASRAYHQLVGHRDIVGRPVAEVFPEATEQGLVAALDRVLETGQPFVAEIVRLTLQRTPGAEPEERFANFVYQPLVEADGTRSGVFCHGVDVTEQVHATATLRENEMRHRLMFDEAGIGMAVCHVDGRIEQANAALCEFFGYPAQELVGMKYQDILHPDDLASDRRESDALEAGTITSFTLERRYFRKDGSTVWGLLTAALLRNADGSPARRIAQVQDITERKRAELALQESEARIRTLVETTHEGIWAVDQVGVTTYVNARLCAILGHDAGEILGRPLFDFMAPHAAFEARTLFARRQRGISEVHEFAFLRCDGSELFVLMSTSPLFATDGEFAGALAMVTDITERRRMEHALRESEARYRHVIANTPGTVYQFAYRPDGTKGYTFVSEGVRAMFGIEPEALLEDSTVLLARIHPDDREPLVQHARSVAEAAGEFRWEGRAVLPSGEERFVQVVAHDQRLEDGTVLSDGLVIDVTEQRRAAYQLEQSEIRFRLAARATNDVVYDWNIPADAHFWGETLFTAFGYDPAAFRPTYEWWASLIHPADAPRVTGRLRAVLDSTSEAWTEEYRFRRSDGTYARVLDRGYVQRDDAARAVRLVGSMTDLTAHQLLEEQIRQSQKMEAVGRLAGGVAHDFNNLITVIKASASFVLADMDAADGRREDVRQIEAAADRAAGLTRQLLAFSRKQILNPRVLCINGVVENLRAMLARLIGEHIAVETKLGEGIGRIMADVGQLEQVLINLAVNARDAMPDGGRILVETAQVRLDTAYAAGHAAQERMVVVPGEYVMLSVSDTGTGMSRDVQARIFEPFYTTKEAGKGTGLGLSTVYGIIKQSGGHVWVYSEPGHGTVFKLYFPRVANVAATPLGQGVIGMPGGGTETILLVEDEDALRRLARRILERHGYHVLESRNGREALERATQYEGPIHLVLTDVIMPEMSGRGLAERLRAVRPRAAVLYMSGYTDDDVLRRGLFEPGSRFVQKPFVPEALLRVVREVLETGHEDASAVG